MKAFQCDAVFPVANAKEVSMILFTGEALAGTDNIGFYRRQIGIFFQIVPEEAPFQSDAEGRKPVDDILLVLLQEGGINGGGGIQADAENTGVVFFGNGGIELGCIVHTIPLQ